MDPGASVPRHSPTGVSPLVAARRGEDPHASQRPQGASQTLCVSPTALASSAVLSRTRCEVVGHAKASDRAEGLGDPRAHQHLQEYGLRRQVMFIHRATSVDQRRWTGKDKVTRSSPADLASAADVRQAVEAHRSRHGTQFARGGPFPSSRSLSGGDPGDGRVAPLEARTVRAQGEPSAPCTAELSLRPSACPAWPARSTATSSSRATSASCCSMR